MRRYSEAIKADVRRRMSPPHRQSVARISEELGIHMITLYKWRKTWRLQGEVVPASEKDPDAGGSAADKFTVVLETAGLNATELSAYCRERGLFPVQVSRWRQAATDANAKPVLTMAEQKELEKLRAQDQREIKALKKELERKEKAPGLIQSVSQSLLPELPAWGLVGGIAASLCPKPPLPQLILI